jgi:chromosome segregation ATPase
MPTTTVPTIIDKLQSQIIQLETEIAGVESAIACQQTENEGLAEALTLLENPPRYQPSSEQFELFHRLREYVAEAESTVDRQFRWNAAHSALSDGRAAIATLHQKLNDLRQGLAAATEELDWQTNYEPHVLEYKAGFTMPSPEDRKVERIKLLSDDIADKQMQMQRATAWLNSPTESRSYYSGDALRESAWLREAIPILEGDLQQLIAQPIGEDPFYDQKLREYIRARVAIASPLQQLLDAQEAYLAALSNFKAALSANPIAAEFAAAELKQPRLVSAETSIRLA